MFCVFETFYRASRETFPRLHKRRCGARCCGCDGWCCRPVGSVPRRVPKYGPGAPARHRAWPRITSSLAYATHLFIHFMGCLPFLQPCGIIRYVKRCNPSQACFPSSLSPSPSWNVPFLTPTLFCSTFFQTFSPLYAFHPKPDFGNACMPLSSPSPPNSMGRQTPTSVLSTVWGILNFPSTGKLFPVHPSNY